MLAMPLMSGPYILPASEATHESCTCSWTMALMWMRWTRLEKGPSTMQHRADLCMWYFANMVTLHHHKIGLAETNCYVTFSCQLHQQVDHTLPGGGVWRHHKDCWSKPMLLVAHCLCPWQCRCFPVLDEERGTSVQNTVNHPPPPRGGARRAFFASCNRVCKFFLLENFSTQFNFLDCRASYFLGTARLQRETHCLQLQVKKRTRRKYEAIYNKHTVYIGMVTCSLGSTWVLELPCGCLRSICISKQVLSFS